MFIKPLFFGLCKHFFAIIHLYNVHFLRCWVCIVFLFVVVFLLSTYSFPSLLFSFLIFLFFIFFWQQSTCLLSMDTRL
jgi:hypothetical protein